MGVKLHDLIQTSSITLADLKGTKVAIDGMNMLYQILFNPAQAMFNPQQFYTDRTQQVITHLYGWLQKIHHFFKARIFPVIVFDGKPDPLKRLLTKDYLVDYIQSKQNYQAALDQHDRDAARQFALSYSYLFPKCIEESKMVISACGIPVIMAPSEAEAQCAFLQKEGYVDYMVSQDYDALLFGATRILRRLTFQTREQHHGHWRTITPTIEVINSLANLSELHLTREELIDLSILLGNDYFPGIQQIGPQRALEILHHYHSIPAMRQVHPGLFRELTEENYAHIRALFFSPEVIHPTLLTLHPMQPEILEQLLFRDHFLSRERAGKILDHITTQHRLCLKNTDLFPSLPNNSTKPPITFNKHIQRRLDRGHKKSHTDPVSYSFSPATQLNTASPKPHSSSKYRQVPITRKITVKKQEKKP